MKIYLVSCVKTKIQTGQHQAKNLYISTWFKYARQYAETHADQWFILSAKHCLVEPDQLIENYEETLNTKRKTERLEWAKAVFYQIQKHVTHADTVVFLAGVNYREFLAPRLERLGCRIEIPMKSLRQGQQTSWLISHV